MDSKQLTPAQLELKEELKDLLKDHDIWTPGQLAEIKKYGFQSANTIRATWMKGGIKIDGVKYRLLHWQIGKFLFTKKRWVIDFILSINPHLGE